jgi:hypothetical protein
VTDDEYVEPNDEQLAEFLIVYMPRLVGMDTPFTVPRSIIERMLKNPEWREVALGHHRKFQKDLKKLMQKVERGQLRCDHILQSGKQCPNFNEPGSFYCGLHKDEEDHDGAEVPDQLLPER